MGLSVTHEHVIERNAAERDYFNTRDTGGKAAYLMLLCGLRRDEVCSLDVRALPTPAGHSSNKAIKMTLDPLHTRSKGSKERWVMVPYDLAGHLFD